MADAPTKMFWMGENVETMDRDELIQVISDLARQLSYHHAPRAIRARALGEVEMIKRGEIADDRIPF